MHSLNEWLIQQNEHNVHYIFILYFLQFVLSFKERLRAIRTSDQRAVSSNSLVLVCTSFMYKLLFDSMVICIME